MSQTIAILDYSMGNLHSVAKALEHVAEPGDRIRVTDDPQAIAAADRIVFPGQGAARDCMAAIDRHHLRDPILEAAAAKPFLGICMGLQVLLRHSEENEGTDLLGLFPGEVRHLSLGREPDGHPIKIPHMGWNRVHQTRPHPLWNGIPEGGWFYFVHSYFVDPEDKDLATGETDHGRVFTCAIGRDNLFAVQFHPEKSADHGLRLLHNFVRWRP